ncbi:unnamed protein product [Mytilus coruscus]|uniref:EF-hand domain-containing protein n=1 Tax=Mytilus coruscus TaxID=42192 RepID=A0A6J8D1H7_MYTCO|nr:unnamed protein product [Mytilus coruscus]
MKLTLAVCIVLIGMILADDLVPNLIVQSVKTMHQNRSKRSLKPSMDDSVKMAFSMTDKNHDGHITVDELIQFVKKTTGITIDETTRQGFNMVFGNPKYDLNENGTIELNEYAGLMRIKGAGIEFGKFDRQVYAIDQQVKWALPTTFDCHILQMDGFHILSCFNDTIGKGWGNGGLPDLLMNSPVYAAATNSKDCGRISGITRQNPAVMGWSLTRHLLADFLSEMKSKPGSINDKSGEHDEKFDRQVYAINQQVKWALPTTFDCHILRMDGFHILSCFNDTIGKGWGDGGLPDLLMNSPVYAAATVDHMLGGNKLIIVARKLVALHYDQKSNFKSVHSDLNKLRVNLRLLKMGLWPSFPLVNQHLGNICFELHCRQAYE